MFGWMDRLQRHWVLLSDSQRCARLDGGGSAPRPRSNADCEVLRFRAETEKQLEPLVNVGQFARRHLSEDPADAALVDRSQVIDEGIGRFREATRSSRKRGVQRANTGRTGHGNNGDQGKALIGVDRRIAHRDAGAHASLLATDGGIEFDEHDGAAIDSHADSFTQP